MVAQVGPERAVYRSPTTDNQYIVHPTLLRTNALPALIAERDRRRSVLGDYSALVEGYSSYGSENFGLTLPPFELVALRFNGRATVGLVGSDHRPQPRFISQGLGFAAPAPGERLETLKTYMTRWVGISTELIPEQSENDTPNIQVLAEHQIEALRRLQLTVHPIDDFRFLYLVPDAGITSIGRPVREQLPDNFRHLTTVSIIE